MGLFHDRRIEGKRAQVPTWFMRQAGRYHSHYQERRKKYDFMTLCKDPNLACEVTLGPIEEFHFDAAIMFSDLLFPLENLNLGLTYQNGPPQLGKKIISGESMSDIFSLQAPESFYRFQFETISLLKKKLPPQCSLIGFVGAPFTLYSYAVEGSHHGNLTESKLGFVDGRFDHFMEKLYPELLANMRVQAEARPCAMGIFDTAAGELSLYDYKKYVLPVLKRLTREFKREFPEIKIIYYSKFTHLSYLQAIEDDHIDVLGVDWRHSLPLVLETLGSDYFIQGNLDPSHLFLPWTDLEEILQELWQSVKNCDLSRWIFGLGHGVLPGTPEENVKKTVEFIHQNFWYDLS